MLESHLHRMVYELSKENQTGLSFIKKPIIYSYDLYDLLKVMEGEGLVRRTAKVHSRRPSVYKYYLTEKGFIENEKA